MAISYDTRFDAITFKDTFDEYSTVHTSNLHIWRLFGVMIAQSVPSNTQDEGKVCRQIFIPTTALTMNWPKLHPRATFFPEFYYNTVVFSFLTC